MTLEEAIKQSEDIADANERVADVCKNHDKDFAEERRSTAKYYRQLAEWLKELKAYRNAITEMKKWINSNNRGNADYFIVDKIEGIIKEVNADDESNKSDF